MDLEWQFMECACSRLASACLMKVSEKKMVKSAHRFQKDDSSVLFKNILKVKQI